MIESVDALINSHGCFLILACYKELDRADMVGETWVLPHPTKSPLGCLTTLSVGLGPMPCPGLPSGMQKQALSVSASNPVTGPGPG